MAVDTASVASVAARYPVVAAYLFGSQSTGQATPLSDIDVAVLLEGGDRLLRSDSGVPAL
ncbi:MAG: nucleotidyltransferase family protein [Vicinamibacterales bacterium]